MKTICRVLCAALALVSGLAEADWNPQDEQTDTGEMRIAQRH